MTLLIYVFDYGWTIIVYLFQIEGFDKSLSEIMWIHMELWVYVARLKRGLVTNFRIQKYDTLSDNNWFTLELIEQVLMWYFWLYVSIHDTLNLIIVSAVYCQQEIHNGCCMNRINLDVYFFLTDNQKIYTSSMV